MLVAAIASALIACAPPLASADSPAELCQLRHSPDYAAPLAEMPRADPPPEGELPFGPRNFAIHRIDSSPVALEGGHFGYRFAGKNSGHRVLRLNWRLVATLRAVDADGQARRVLARRKLRVGAVKDLNSMEIAFPAAHQGFYRVDLTIAKLGERRLGAYREYFRVLRPSVDVEIAVSGTGVRPGEAVYGLLENHGAGRITAPGYLEVERREGGIWVAVPQPPNPNRVMGTNWWMSSGEVGRCYRFDVPPSAMPGVYRFTTSVYVNNLQRRQTVAAPFQVVP